MREGLDHSRLDDKVSTFEYIGYEHIGIDKMAAHPDYLIDVQENFMVVVDKTDEMTTNKL